ncbi:MAG: hypothetical protein AB1324_00125, partial [Candidatus Micrarchaeota archaeon]
VINSENVTITSSISSDNAYGFLLSESPGAVISEVTACGNAGAGLLESTSSGSASTITDSLFCDSGWAIQQASFNSVPFSVANTQIGSSSVVISIEDEIGSGGGGYNINETPAPGAAPSGYDSFRGKYLKIFFAGDLGINSTAFHWTDGEASGYDESSIRLFTWNGSGWLMTPNQTTNPPSNNLTVLNLTDMFGDDTYGLFAFTSADTDGGGGDGGGDGGAPEEEPPPAPECASSDQCAVNEVCSAGICTPFECDCGFASDHSCVAYQCCFDADCGEGEVCIGNACQPEEEPPEEEPQGCTSDSGCAGTEYCAIPAGTDTGSCKPVQSGACGEIKDHAFVPYGYECGTEPGCPSCPSGEQCVNHACVSADVSCPTSGIVGEDKTCSATEEGGPCINCDIAITDPTGKTLSGKTDENGNFEVPLSVAGSYKVSLLKDGNTVKVISVQALPKSTSGEEGQPPAAAGQDASGFLWFGVLVLVIAAAAVLWRRSRK